MDQDSPVYNLQEASLKSLNLIRDEIQNLFANYEADNSSIDITLKQLFWYLSSRSQAVSFLASHGYIWDSEIILRSLYETAAKIMLICFSEKSDKENLINEYWTIIGNINNRRTSRKAEFSMDTCEADDVGYSIFEMLRDENIFDTKSDYTRAERNVVERKWSFSEIIDSLQYKSVDGKPLFGMKSLLHIYGMASHRAHADRAAMDLMTDRAMRPSEERLILENAHLSRIFLDQVSLCWFCADALRSHFGGSFTFPDRMREAFDEPARQSKAVQSAFYESQRELYNRWRDSTANA